MGKFEDRTIKSLPNKYPDIKKPIDIREKSGEGFAVTLFPSNKMSLIYLYHFNILPTSSRLMIIDSLLINILLIMLLKPFLFVLELPFKIVLINTNKPSLARLIVTIFSYFIKCV